MASTPIKRSLIARFLNTTPSAAATYALIGDGVSTAAPEMGPQSETTQYIHQDSATTELTGYQPTLPIEQECKMGDSVYDFIESLYWDRAILSDAYTDMVEVQLHKTPTGEAYPAFKQDVTVQIDRGPGGAGNEKAKIAYTLAYRGDPVPGTFNPTTKAFTPTP